VEGGEAGGAEDRFDIEASGFGGRERWHEAHPIREHVGGEWNLPPIKQFAIISR
jgi:hypothetical protein